MKICVLNTGSPQSINRTIAISKFAEIIEFIELGKITDNHKLLKHANIPINNFKNKKLVVFKLAKYLKTIKADAYICFFSSGSHVLSSILANKHPLALVAMGGDIQYNEGNRKQSMLKKLIIRKSVLKADYISAKSNKIINIINKWGYKNKISLNYWGANLKIFKPTGKIEARIKLGLPLNKKIILSSRAFAPHYNLNLIAEAFARLSKKIDNVELIFIGRPTDKNYISKIKNIIKNNDDEDIVRFDFNVGVNQVVDYYNATDLAVTMTRTEGFPNTILELFACKTPVVAGRIPQLEELLTDEKNIIFCELNTNDIYKKLTQYLKPKATTRLQQITTNGYELVKKVGDINNNALRFVNDLENISTTKNKHFSFVIFFLVLLNYLLRKIKLCK